MTTTPPKNRRGSREAASVRVAAAKGRPMLSWVGKRPLREVRAFPAQLVERFAAEGSVSTEVDWSDWPDRYERGGLLFHGDNKEVLAHLLANGFRGKVDLVYIDPPFDSGADYVRRVQLRGASGTARLDGEAYTLGEQIQYTDIWANDTYLQFMYERLLLLKELLSPRGTVYLHLDYRRVHALRLVMDEVFGLESFRNEVVWTYRGKGLTNQKSKFPPYHATILSYGRGEQPIFSPVREADIADSVMRRFGKYMDGEGRITFGALRAGNELAELEKAMASFMAENNREPQDDDIARHYQGGALVRDVWTDISVVRENERYEEYQGFPTQKPEALLDRIIRASSSPGSIVLDCFVGSGTTAAVAQKLGRRWIGADINKGAIQTTVKRLSGVMEEQASASVQEQQRLLTDDDAATSPPAQLSFTTWRVNDYDLQIQHNEAVELACERMGVERTKADGFFAGTLGKELVRIVEFTHPVSPPDLEAVVAELDARKTEERDVVVVALGREIACEKWLEDWNRGRPVNRMRIVELRSDPKYGELFEHRPAQARVRLDGERVVIDDFISPSIIERLGRQEGIVAPQITDWRSMVDSVMIDTAYDGSTFDVDVADIPERKADLVAGLYDLELPAGSSAPVAVKITDMLGEEVLVLLERAAT
jgi:DNA modification methylase